MLKPLLNELILKGIWHSKNVYKVILDSADEK